MKMSIDYQKAQQNMLPGAITQEGFLGDDNRALVDIIQADELQMDSLALRFESVVEKLDYLLHEGLRGLGEPITVDGTWLVQVDEARGYLPCPFEDGIYRKRNVSVKHLATGASINFSDLSIHLINVHHFFQGKGAPYRLEPTLLNDILGFVSDGA